MEENINPFAETAQLTERLHIEEALLASQIRLAGIVDSAMDAIISIDKEQRIQLFNRAAEKMFRCPATEAIGCSLDRFIPERFRPRHSSHIRSFGETGVTTRTMAGARTIYGLRADGKEFPVEASISQVEVGGEKLYTVILRDITERERAEERFRQVIERAPDGMVMVDGEGKIVQVNAQIEKSFGYSRAELLGYPIEMLVPHRYHGKHSNYRSSFMANATARPMGSGRELYGLRKDGSEFPVEISLNPLETERGLIVLSTIVDITERKRAEASLREREQQLSLIANNIPGPLSRLDRNLRFLFANKAYERWFGKPVEEIIGHTLEEVLGPVAFARAKPNAERALKGEQVTFENQVQNPAGKIFYGQVTMVPQRSAEGEVNGIIILVADITERKQAENILRESEAFKSSVLNSMSAHVAVLDKNGNIIAVNEAWEQFTRENTDHSEGLVQMGIGGNYLNVCQQVAFSHPESAQAAQQGIQSILDGDKQSFTLEYDFHSPNQERWFILSATALRIQDGGAVVSHTNITERKHAEKALREKEQQLYLADRRLAEIVHGMTEACFALDADWRFVFVNDRGKSLLRHSRAEMIGHSIWEVFYKLVGTPMEAHYRRAMTERVPVSFEAFSPIAERWLDIRLFPSGDGLAAFLLDIHERKLAEAERQKFVSLAENSVEFIGMCDLQGIPFFVNEAGLRLVGLDNLEQALQTPVTEFFFPEDQTFIAEKFLPQVQREGHGEVEIRFRHFKTGEASWMIYNVFLIRDVIGQPVGFATVSRDITERKQAEEKVYQLNEELERRVIERTAELQAVNKELEAFSYSVSHDLRAPLRHINGFSQALLEDYTEKLDETGKGYLQTVRSASQEMAQLIDDLLQLARVTRSEMRREVVNLSNLAHQIIAELEKIETGRTVTVNIAEGLLVHGDKRLLQVMLNNLLGNAWKFTAKRVHAEITFGQTEKDGESYYFVRDNGAGFDMAYSNKLFGAFQRLHTAQEFEGTGIGLATVQRVVRRHGGRVWAEGKVNKGATIYFTLADFKETENGEEGDLIGGR